MPTFEFTDPNGKEYSVDGPDGATKEQAFAILQQHLGGQETASKAPKGAANLVAPIANLPSAYSEMVNQSVGQMGSGAQRAVSGAKELGSGNLWQGAKDVALGAGEAGLGALGYATAPINAPIHTVVGQPAANIAEAATGSKPVGQMVGNAAELGATMLLPIPKAIPRAASVEKAAEAPSAALLKSTAKAGFKSPEITGLELHPAPVRQWKEVVTADLNKEGFDDTLAPKTFGVLKRLEDQPKSACVSGQNLQSLRRALGRAAGTMDLTEKAAAEATMRHLDNFVETLPAQAVRTGDAEKAASVWKDARGNYAAAMRSERISDTMDKAERQASAANSGMNLGNAARQRINSILNSPKAKRGFSDNELDQMRQIVKGTFTGNATRRVGNLLGGGGGLGAVASGAMGAMAGYTAHGASGAFVGNVLAPAVGYGMKKLSNSITAKEVETLDNLVRSRSPLAAQMRAPLKKWGEASAAYEASPTTKNVARLLISSRNLSKNLEDAGITVTPENLIAPPSGQSSTQPPRAK